MHRRNPAQSADVLPGMVTTTVPSRRLVAASIAILVILLAGCAASTEPGDDVEPTRRPTRSDPAVEPVPSESSPAVVGEVPQRLLDQILADAAEKSGIGTDALEVLRAEAVTWSDGSLDCPEPGMLYTQALVDGYHVVVAADDAELDYRATTNGTFRLCENPGPPAGG